MRKLFSEELYQHMKDDKNIYLLLGDLGYKIFDTHLKDFPDRAFTVGASEQTMLDMAVGMAYEGKKVFCYTITPFLYRAFETIRTYIVHEHLPIVLVGSGRDTDYEHDGYSHDASDIKSVLGALGGLTMYFPENSMAIAAIMRDAVRKEGPVFISLRR